MSEAPKAESPLKTVEGKISVLHPETRSFNLWREDFKVTISYAQNKDDEMGKFKQWDAVKVTYEVGTPNRLTEIVPLKKGVVGGAKRDYVPKNEKPILYESILKSCCDVASPDDFKEATYEQKMDRIAAQAKKIYQDVVQLVGA
jgi:hypothetical protein